MFDNNYLFPFDTGLSHNCPHLSHSSHLFHIFARAAHTPISPIPLSLLIPPTSLTSLPVRLALPLALPKKFFSLLLHYTYHIQTIQEERTKSEKSAKYKHLIKVPKVVCFTFQLF